MQFQYDRHPDYPIFGLSERRLTPQLVETLELSQRAHNRLLAYISCHGEVSLNTVKVRDLASFPSVGRKIIEEIIEKTASLRAQQDSLIDKPEESSTINKEERDFFEFFSSLREKTWPKQISFYDLRFNLLTTKTLVLQISPSLINFSLHDAIGAIQESLRTNNEGTPDVIMLTNELVDQMRLSRRPHNCLRALVSSEPRLPLTSLTRHKLLSLPRLGRKSMDEILAKLAEINSEVSVGATQHGHLLINIEKVAEELQLVSAKVKLLNSLSLNEVLIDFLLSHDSSKKHDKDCLYKRFGINTHRTLTLEECGDMLGITRERVRQLEAKIKRNLPHKKMADAGSPSDKFPFIMPGLQEAVDYLKSLKVALVSELPDKLIEAGISKTPISAEAILEFSRITNQDISMFHVHTVYGKKYSHTQTLANQKGQAFVNGQAIAHYNETQYLSVTADPLKDVATHARKLFSRNGIADVNLIASTPTEISRAFLKTQEEFYPLEDGERWWILKDFKEKRNRLVNIAKKILCISNPVFVFELAEGFQKVARLRKSTGQYKGVKEIVPPDQEIILKYFSILSNFEVEATQIKSLTALDPAEILGPTEFAIYELGEKKGEELMSRQEILDLSKNSHVKESSLQVATSFSPILEHVGLDTFKLVGRNYDESYIESHVNKQRRSLRKRRSQKKLFFRWEDDKIRVIVTIPSLQNVWHLPKEIQKFLDFKEFKTYTRDGHRLGIMKRNDRYTLYSFHFLGRLPGSSDVFDFSFDVNTGKVMVARIEESSIPSWARLENE